jgi:hypothetical protein
MWALTGVAAGGAQLRSRDLVSQGRRRVDGRQSQNKRLRLEPRIPFRLLNPSRRSRGGRIWSDQNVDMPRDRRSLIRWSLLHTESMMGMI